MENKKQTTSYLSVSEYIYQEPSLPIPPEGMCYKRKVDGFIRYGAIYLGKEYIIGGKQLDSPIDEKPEDYELIDESDPDFKDETE